MLLAALGSACGTPRRSSGVPYENPAASRVDVFLQARASDVGDVLVSLEAVELRDETGATYPLALSEPDLSSRAASRRTRFAGAVVEPGVYDALLVRVREARLVRDGAETVLRLRPPQAAEKPAEPDLLDEDLQDPASEPEVTAAQSYELPLRLRVAKRDAASIFLTWDVDGSLLEGDAFRFALDVTLEKPQARLGLLYACDARTGTVLALERGSGEVVATGKAGRGPRALALSDNRRHVFVANRGDGSVSVLDTRKNLTDFTVPIRLGADTSDLVAVPGWIAAANTGLDTVSFIDGRNFSRVDDVRVGRAPVRILAVPRLRRLFVANSVSSDVSVLDVGSRDVIATLPVETSPSALAVDRREREVFVGHENSRNLLVLDAESLVLLDTVTVGDRVTAVLADRLRDRIYVARSRPAELLVVDRRLSAVVRRIPLSGPVMNLAQPKTGPLVFGAAPELGGLVAINVIVGEEEPFLPCGAAPHDVLSVD